jgi:hypothetical protein
MAEAIVNGAARVPTSRALDIAGLASLASPMHAVLSPHCGAGSSAGPAAGMLRNAVRGFVEGVRREVLLASQEEIEPTGFRMLVANDVERGVSGIVANHRANAPRPGRHISVRQGGETSAAGARVRALVEGASRGAERRLDEVRAHLAPLAKFVDGAHAAATGPDAARLYSRLARSVILASAAGVATLTLSGGALAGQTRAEIEASRAGVSVDDLFSASFGGMVKPPQMSAGKGPAAVAAPAARPAPAPVRVAQSVPDSAGPSQAFRGYAEPFLAARGLSGGLGLDGLLADARSCARDYSGGAACRISRDGVHVDLAAGRFEIRSASGTPLVLESPGQPARVENAAALAEAMRPSVREVGATVNSKAVQRRTTPDGKVYFEPSAAFLKLSYTILEMAQRDGNWARDVQLKAIEEARACATGPARPEGCLVRSFGLALDMSEGRFSIASGWERAQETKTLVVETRDGGLQIPDPMALALRMQDTLDQSYALKGSDALEGALLRPADEPGLGGPGR